ncbi:MAG: 30S ribosomal protein S4 [Chlamydiia bacterium]|nr:30S ribosomal protein S4 [Chlamydiia bacterium]
MGRYTGPKNRIARRFGTNIFGRTRNPLAHKANPPGVHGARRRKKSDFGLQLEEKQKLKACYGMLSEKQLLRYYRKAINKSGNTMANLIHELEARLDIVVYRLKFANTIFQAQQLVAHGHIEVDGKKVDIRSYQVRPGCFVSVREKSRKMKIVQEAKESGMRSVPEYFQIDAEKFTGQMLSLPELEQVPLPIEVNIPVVCEFLAHNH